MQWGDLDQQPCSVARTLSVIGDRWTLLILRDCFLRVRRFDDFQSRLGIGRPILADRLQKLVDNFVLTKMAYQQNPVRYEYRLTQKGLDLYPVVMAIVHWGDVHMSGKKGRPLLHRHVTCGHHFDPVWHDRGAGPHRRILSQLRHTRHRSGQVRVACAAFGAGAA